MTTFDEFSREFWAHEVSDSIPHIDFARAAFEAGRASASVITAYQLREKLIEIITEHDAETGALSERIAVLGNARVARSFLSVRDEQIYKHRTALRIVSDLIECMEKEREATP